VRLRGVPGVPRCHGFLDGKHLVLEHVPGPSLRACDAQLQDRERFFAELLATIEAIQASGVAHGDLKRKNNIVVDPNERPYIIDFGIARLRRIEREGRGGPMFEWVRQLDYNAWAKLKYRRRMDVLSPEDAARYRPLRLERLARLLRIPWQKLRHRQRRRQLRVRQSRAS
jgi:serine/threonine protein kinase